jgi:hypothetical protein
LPLYSFCVALQHAEQIGSFRLSPAGAFHCMENRAPL